MVEKAGSALPAFPNQIEITSSRKKNNQYIKLSTVTVTQVFETVYFLYSTTTQLVHEMSAEQKILNLEQRLKDKKTRAKGTMTASWNGVNFLTSETVHFEYGKDTIALLGTAGTGIAVVLSYPLSLGAGTHVVLYPQSFTGLDGYLHWQAKNHDHFLAATGTMTVTLNAQGNMAKGTFSFQSDSGSDVVTGQFDIQQ